MQARASKSIYWPGIHNHIKIHRDNCKNCSYNAPSQPKEPLVLSPQPEWPFQQVCGDYFDEQGHSYLAIADRFSGWLCLCHFRHGSATSHNLIANCRSLFMNYGAPEEFSSDGGPQFTSSSFETFLKTWGVKHCISSVGYPQSNGRAEAAVKTAKRIIRENTSKDGSINNDNIAKAIMQYRNTPLPTISLSPAQILFHRELRDFTPSHPTHYQLHKDWIITQEQREHLASKHNIQQAARYNTTTHELQPITLGTPVLIQNKAIQIIQKSGIKLGL